MFLCFLISKFSLDSPPALFTLDRFDTSQSQPLSFFSIRGYLYTCCVWIRLQAILPVIYVNSSCYVIWDPWYVFFFFCCCCCFSYLSRHYYHGWRVGGERWEIPNKKNPLLFINSEWCASCRERWQTSKKKKTKNVLTEQGLILTKTIINIKI